MWLNPSSPFSASGFLYSGSKTIRPQRFSTSPLCLGIPNLVGKSVSIRAIIFNVCSFLGINSQKIVYHRKVYLWMMKKK